MSKYHVTYYYLVTGMEGRADKQDHGVVEAESKDGAIRAVLKKYYANDRHDWEWISGCLTARLVKDGRA
jgi:hypothetical protein